MGNFPLFTHLNWALAYQAMFLSVTYIKQYFSTVKIILLKICNGLFFTLMQRAAENRNMFGFGRFFLTAIVFSLTKYCNYTVIFSFSMFFLLSKLSDVQGSFFAFTITDKHSKGSVLNQKMVGPEKKEYVLVPLDPTVVLQQQPPSITSEHDRVVGTTVSIQLYVKTAILNLFENIFNEWTYKTRSYSKRYWG